MQNKGFRIKTGDNINPLSSLRQSASISSTHEAMNIVDHAGQLTTPRTATIENKFKKNVSNKFKPKEGQPLSSRTPKSVSTQYLTLGIKDQKISELFDKIVDKEVKQVYPSEHSQDSKAETIDLNYLDEVNQGKSPPTTKSNPNTRVRSPRSPIKSHHKGSVTHRNFEIEALADGSLTPPRSPLKDAHYVFNPLDSKFNEIQDLKKQLNEVKEKNDQLQNHVLDMDEFEIILNKKTRPEVFNEKRCDILKACILKQKRQIDNLNKSVRLMNKFYKDLKAVLQFLIELDKKYVRGRKLEGRTLLTEDNQASEEPKRVEISSKKKTTQEVGKKVVVDIFQEMNGSIELVAGFLRNFNEAYDRFKLSSQKDEEIGKLFNMGLSLLKSSNVITQKLNPETQKRVKYNYLFNNFIKSYRRIFPIYTVFNEFDLRDKNDFTSFVTQLIEMGDKIDEVLKQVKKFNLIRNIEYNYKIETPEKLITHNADFEYYFNHHNRQKHMYLNSNEIFKTERQLAHMLDELIKFHNMLSQKREDLTAEAVFKLQEEVRTNVENLLKLGICTNVEFTAKDKIILVNSKNDSEIPCDFLKNHQQAEKRLMFQIYNEEYESLKNTSKLTHNMNQLWEDTFKISRELENTQLSSNLYKIKHLNELLEKNYTDMALVSKLKSCELDFVREYSRIIVEDAEKLEGFVKDKVGSLDDQVKKANTGAKELNNLIDIFFDMNNPDGKVKIDLFRKFKRAIKEVIDPIAKILNKAADNPMADIFNLEAQFKNELEKLYKNFKINSEKIKDLRIEVTNC